MTLSFLRVLYVCCMRVRVFYFFDFMGEAAFNKSDQ